MQANHGRDTAPELAVRRRLHATGLRYRVDTAPEPGLRRQGRHRVPQAADRDLHRWVLLRTGSVGPLDPGRINALSCSNKIATKARPDLDTRDRR